MRPLLLLAPLFLSGCAGVAVGTYGKVEYQYDRISISDHGNVYPHREKSYTREEVIRKLGQPDNISHVGSCEVLSYYDGYSWSGIGIWAVLFPVPLLVPTGYEEAKFYIKEGETVSYVKEKGEVLGALGYMCGSNDCNVLLGDTQVGPNKASRSHNYRSKVPVTWCG